MEAFSEIEGIARRHRYDNLKSVVTSRKPELILNAQCVDFARHYGFSIYPCNPGRGNEKGRVERAIRDIRPFIETTDFAGMAELNRKTGKEQANTPDHRKGSLRSLKRREPHVPARLAL
jgi:transposase